MFHDGNAQAPWRNIWPAAPLHSLHQPFPQCLLPICKSFAHSLLSFAALCISLSSCNTIAVWITVAGSPGGRVAVSPAPRWDTRRKMLQKQRQLFSAAKLCCGSPSPAAAGKAAICSHRSLLSWNRPVCTGTVSQSIAQPSCRDSEGGQEAICSLDRLQWNNIVSGGEAAELLALKISLCGHRERQGCMRFRVRLESCCLDPAGDKV